MHIILQREATTAFKYQRSQVSAEHHPAILSRWSAHQRHDATCQVQCRRACVRKHPGLEGVVFGGSPSNRTVLFEQLHVLRLHAGIKTNASTRLCVGDPNARHALPGVGGDRGPRQQRSFKDLRNATPVWLAVNTSLGKKDAIAYSSKMA